MHTNTEADLRVLFEEVRHLRRAYRNLQRLTLACVLALLSLVFLFVTRSPRVQASTTDEQGNLHVRGLVVEDQSGRERVRLGAPLPDPMIHGARHKRQGAVSGLSVSDAAGNERGGLVTSDQFGEAFIGLDSEDAQQVLFLVNPKGGVHLDLFDQHGNEADLAVFPKGPHLVMKRGRSIVAELPAASK